MDELEQTKRALAEAQAKIDACGIEVMELKIKHAEELDAKTKECNAVIESKTKTFCDSMKSAIKQRKGYIDQIEMYKAKVADLEAEKQALLAEHDSTLVGLKALFETAIHDRDAQFSFLKERCEDLETQMNALQKSGVAELTGDLPVDTAVETPVDTPTEKKPEPTISKSKAKALNKSREANLRKQQEEKKRAEEAARLEEIEREQLEKRRMEFEAMRLAAQLKQVDHMPKVEKKIRAEFVGSMEQIKLNEKRVEKRIADKLKHMQAKQQQLNEMALHTAKALADEADAVIQVKNAKKLINSALRGTI